MKEIALVVPTIREDCAKKFIAAWDGLPDLFGEVDLVVVEDNPSPTFDLPEVGSDPSDARPPTHLSWEDIGRELGEREWIIPRRSDTVRSFGYWWAWRAGYRYICTMDDDCYPQLGDPDSGEPSYHDWVVKHRRALDGRAKWWSTLNTARPRGLPYRNLGIRDDIYVNHGLWTNVVDYDACNQLANPVEEEFDHGNAIVPHGSYFPMCGMNLMWRREATVLMYHLLMGRMFTSDRPVRGVVMIPGDDHARALERCLQVLPYDRFGDIWCGVLMKRCLDHLGWSCSSGTPYVRHDRASDPFANLRKEANGIGTNEKFWEHVDRFRPNPTFIDPVELYYQLGRWVRDFRGAPEFPDYFEMLGDAMVTWTSLFTGK